MRTVPEVAGRAAGSMAVSTTPREPGRTNHRAPAAPRRIIAPPAGDGAAARR